MSTTESDGSTFALDLLRQRVGEECDVRHLAEEINRAFGSTGVAAEVDDLYRPSLDIRVPISLPQGMDAAIVTLVVVGYRGIRYELTSYVESPTGFRLYSFY